MEKGIFHNVVQSVLGMNIMEENKCKQKSERVYNHPTERHAGAGYPRRWIGSAEEPLCPWDPAFL